MWCIQQIENKHYLQSLSLGFFLCCIFQNHFISGRRTKHPVLASCLWYLPDLGTNTLGHYYYNYYYYSSWFQGMLHSRPLWPELHPVSACFLEYVQWKRQFHTRVGLNMYSGWQLVFSLEKHNIASHKSCNVSTCVCIIDAHSGLGSIFLPRWLGLKNVHWIFHSQIHFHVLVHKRKNNNNKKNLQISSFASFWIANTLTPTLVLIQIFTQTHRHTQTYSHTNYHKRIPFAHTAAVVEIFGLTFCQLLSNSS